MADALSTKIQETTNLWTLVDLGVELPIIMSFQALKRLLSLGGIVAIDMGLMR